ncbi:MAG: flagellar filament capping protein FliD [Terracidiphilus sp.]|jgi:flagellar hook-associated protein 2
MGTVGLSFGSPTSGAGFNVSSTVAEIVSNLRNVETPWKNQLTASQSQDTAISSLGTLFSNLSNDISSLTDFQGVMAQKEGSSSDPNVLTLSAADSTAIAGSHTVTVTNLAQTSSGYLTEIANANDPLTGSITLQAGSGPRLTITLTSSNNTLSGLAATINSSGLGINASVLSDSSGSRLSLVSATSGAGGNIAVTGNTIVATDSVALAYTGGSVSGTQASTGSLAAMANAADTLSGSISIQTGSGTTETIVIGGVPASGQAANTIYTGSGNNTLTGLEKTINLNPSVLGVTASIVASSSGAQSLSLTSNTTGSSGPLRVVSKINEITGTTSLAYQNPVQGQDANLTVDGVALKSASNTVANLIPGVTFQLLAPSVKESDNSLEPVQVVIANGNAGVESTVSQMVSDYNSLISAINTQEGNDSSGNAEPLFGSPTLTLLQQQLLSGLNLQSPNGVLSSISTGTNTTLTGSISIQVGGGAAQTITLSSDNTISGLADAINKAQIGVTANVMTANGESTLSLASQTTGASGALTVDSSIVASSDTAVGYTDTGNSSATAPDSGTLGEIPGENDVLTGSITIQVGGGLSMTVSVPSSPNNTLSGLAGMIGEAPLGVTASVVQNSDGSYSLSLESQTPGSDGDLTVTSNILDTTNTSSATLNYSNSSDINSLTTLGISVNNDGSLTFDATSLDSTLNTDYSGVAGFFQDANSWGQSFNTMLTNAGTGSSTGILKLAAGSNSSVESTLNANISKEENLISAEQSSLTAELNSANEIMQGLPTQLEGINELYSAITGYNQNSNG